MTMMPASLLLSPHRSELSEADLGVVAGGFQLIEPLMTLKLIREAAPRASDQNNLTQIAL